MTKKNEIEGIIIRKKEYKAGIFIYEIRNIKTDETKWVYQNDIDDKYIWKDEYIQIQRDNKINEILMDINNRID
jgi:hypothetical protein